MTTAHRIALCLIALGLSACTTTGAPKLDARSDTQVRAASPALGDDEVLSHFSALPPQTLGEGECGLFLWLKRDDAPLLFFQRSDGQASMLIDGQLVALTRTEKAGRIALEYFERQAFSGGGLLLDVSVAPEEKRSLQQGLKLPSGSVSVTTKDSWSAVLPVVGMIGCK